jgi:hypothetical protein
MDEFWVAGEADFSQIFRWIYLYCDQYEILQCAQILLRTAASLGLRSLL